MQEKKALSSRGRGRLRGFLELRRPWGFSPEVRRGSQGASGGAGGRGPVTSPPLQNMNHPHTRPAPNPGPTMQQKRAGREALASPAQLGTSSPVWRPAPRSGSCDPGPALQAGETLVAARPPQPQCPALRDGLVAPRAPAIAGSWQLCLSARAVDGWELGHRVAPRPLCADSAPPRLHAGIHRAHPHTHTCTPCARTPVCTEGAGWGPQWD